MAEESGAAGERIVLYAVGARIDIASIHLYNASRYSDEHADRYIDQLTAMVESLLTDPGQSRPVADRPGIHVAMFKSTRRRAAHGYQVFWKPVAQGIEVVRVLHTAMNVDLHLPE